jgi:hypothetical protein
MTLVEELRARANDMREKGMVDWAYLCLTAADLISEQEVWRSELATRIEDLEEELVYARARIASLSISYDNLKMERHEVIR